MRGWSSTGMICLALGGGCLAAIVGCERKASPPQAAVAVTNTYLECAVRDLLGADTPVFRLADPALCPGHFDLSASQVSALNGCRVLLRFDFQKPLDARLRASVARGLRIEGVCVAGGLCEPRTYVAACRQTAAALVTAGLLGQSAADTRLTGIAQRIAAEAESCLQRAAAQHGAPVLASVHQAAFCRWLGLRVVATFGGADVLSAREMEAALREGRQAGVKLVIANRPEGRQVADALAQALGAQVVVLDNFPALDGSQTSYSDMLADNVRLVLTASEP